MFFVIYFVICVVFVFFEVVNIEFFFKSLDVKSVLSLNYLIEICVGGNLMEEFIRFRFVNFVKNIFIIFCFSFCC